jgi:POT family proton-dependent oligopeptide transporter
MMTAAVAAPSAPAGKELFGHPVGLWYLCFCEGFERFSYYGMQALLAVYLSTYLLLPGHVERVAGFDIFKSALQGIYGDLPTPLKIAAAATGLYSAGVYATPILGGLIADRWLGRTTTVTIGASLMVLGHFLMAFDVSFVLAILCLFAGVGCFKGNIASQVGELYDANDLRRASAYQVFLLFVQIAVIVAPIATGFLAHAWKPAWHWGFGAAGVGMAIGLVVYLVGRKHLPPERPRGKAAAKAPKMHLTRRDWSVMALLVVMLPVLAATAIGNQEISNAYLLWGKDHYNLAVPNLPSWIPGAASISGQTMPVEWLVGLDAFISTFTVGGAIAFWAWWSKRWKEPDEIWKVAIGALIAAGGPLLLTAAATQEAMTGQKASLAYGLGFHIINDIGFAMVFPVGLALYSRAAPKAVGGLMVSVYYLHLFMCNLATGKVAGLLENMSATAFWTMHAAIVGAGAVVLIVLALFFHRLLAPTNEDVAKNEASETAPA